MLFHSSILGVLRNMWIKYGLCQQITYILVGERDVCKSDSRHKLLIVVKKLLM